METSRSSKPPEDSESYVAIGVFGMAMMILGGVIHVARNARRAEHHRQQKEVTHKCVLVRGWGSSWM